MYNKIIQIGTLISDTTAVNQILMKKNQFCIKKYIEPMDLGSNNSNLIKYKFVPVKIFTSSISGK